MIKSQIISNATFYNKSNTDNVTEETVVASMNQTHSNVVIEVKKSGIYNSDGLITSKKNLILSISTADCMPVIMSDNFRVGAIHIGWKGLENKIFKNALEFFDRSQLKVLIGPHAQSCCYEIQNDLKQKFPNYTLEKNKKLYLNLSEEIYRFSIKNNINLEISKECTIHDESYYSFRRDKTSKRQRSVVWI
mgnify:FL=1